MKLSSFCGALGSRVSARQQRGLGHLAVAGLEHELVVANAGHAVADIVRVEPRDGVFRLRPPARAAPGVSVQSPPNST